MNPTTVADLTAVLRERLGIIADQASRQDPATHMARLQAVSEKIEALQQAISSTADPRLKHYLERRSYDKALEFLEGATQ
jgi:hypothetical protein